MSEDITDNAEIGMDNTDTGKIEAVEVSELQNIIEAALFAAAEPIGVRKIQALFAEEAKPSKESIFEIIEQLTEQYAPKAMDLVKIGSGWRFQTAEKYAPWMRKLSAAKPPRYSRAQLETLAIIAYRQPVTRGDIEEVRGVAVSSDIIRVLEERGWIREIGHRDVPGRPALFGTTQEFLSYFNLHGLSELPELIQERQFQDIAKEMNMNLPLEDLTEQAGAENINNDAVNIDEDGNPVSAEVIPITQAVEQRLSQEEE